MGGRDVLEWQLSQLRRMAGEVDRRPRMASFNPKPPGSIQQGSHTHRALQVLREARGNWISYGVLLERMGEHKSRSIHWALALLIKRGSIECSNADCRNPRYSMYRWKTG